MFKTIINMIIQKIYKNKTSFSKCKELQVNLYNVFKRNGGVIYYANIWSKNNNFMAKTIGFFSEGISHTIPIIYSENLKGLFTQNQWEKIKIGWKDFYGTVDGLNDCKCLAFSADDTGINICDLSRYNGRKMSIRKTELIPHHEKTITMIDFLCDKIDRPYDAIGLIVWLLNYLCSKLGIKDDTYSYYCSELVYDAFSEIGISIAAKSDPSPADIEKYNIGLIVYKNS